MTAFGEQAVLLRENAWRYFEGLTDDELHWEPAPEMWGLRLKTELRTPLEEGAPPGDWWVDSVFPRPAIEPLTTIGWRVVHLTLGTWNWNAIIAGREVPPEPSIPGDATNLVALWRSVLDEFVALADELDDEALAEDVDAWRGKVKRSFLLSHVTLEIAFHSSEVGTLRHLKRATGS